MSSFYGDLLVPDIDPFEAFQHYSASEIQSTLAKLGDIAQSLGLATTWSRAQFVGSDYEPGVPGPAAGQPGVSLAWACVPGVGFWRDHALHSTFPEYLQSLVTDPDERRRAFGQRRTQQIMEEIKQHEREITALLRLSEVAGERMPIPLRIATGIQATWTYEFEIAYRRRIAYTLGFEASIRASSLEPYNHLTEVLVSGTVDRLASGCPPVESPEAFSVYLNLLSTLDGALAFETSKGEVHYALPGAVYKGDTKRLLLVSRLGEAAEKRMQLLPIDGCIALRALLSEQQSLADLGRLYNTTPPLWGKIAASTVYQA